MATGPEELVFGSPPPDGEVPEFLASGIGKNIKDKKKRQ